MINNASYHSVQLNEMLNFLDTKNQIMNWLSTNNIQY